MPVSCSHQTVTHPGECCCCPRLRNPAGVGEWVGGGGRGTVERDGGVLWRSRMSWGDMMRREVRRRGWRMGWNIMGKVGETKWEAVGKNEVGRWNGKLMCKDEAESCNGETM